MLQYVGNVSERQYVVGMAMYVNKEALYTFINCKTIPAEHRKFAYKYQLTPC